MALFDKLGQVAKNISDKTGDAIETTKLSAKVAKENTLAVEQLAKIGEFYYKQYLEGTEVAADVLEFCETAKTHYEAADAAQAEIDRIKAENEAAKAAQQPVNRAGGIVCPNCGATNGEGTNFCQNCGTKLEAAPAPAKKFCTECGAALDPEARFCNSCGTKVG